MGQPLVWTALSPPSSSPPTPRSKPDGRERSWAFKGDGARGIVAGKGFDPDPRPGGASLRRLAVLWCQQQISTRESRGTALIRVTSPSGARETGAADTPCGLVSLLVQPWSRDQPVAAICGVSDDDWNRQPHLPLSSGYVFLLVVSSNPVKCS